MRKIIGLLVMVFVLELKVFAQQVPCSKYLGLQTRLLDYLPIEISFVNIVPKKISLQAKIGFVYAPINTANGYTQSTSTNAIFNNYSFSKEQFLKSFFIKSGVLFHKKYDKYGYKYFALNGVYSFAWNYFEITFDDAIYGKTVRMIMEESRQAGIELEWQRITKDGINLGLLLGYKINKIFPFQSQIQNIEKATTYSPGMGFGSPIYINIVVGYHFRLHKTNK